MQERRLAAIMFADICGFSRIMGANEQRALAIVDMACSCVQSGAELYSGRVIKKMGDGILVEFSSAVNAVRCAMEVQRAVAQHNAEAGPPLRFQMRIGIHVGDIVVADGDILGDGVNVASRIEPLAEPGGICISRDVFDMVHNKLAIEAVSIGPHDLKNIDRRIDIYKVIVDAVAGRRRSPVGWRRRPLLTTAGIAAALALIAACTAAWRSSRARFSKLAEQTFNQVRQAARERLDAGKPAEALEILNSFPSRFKKTIWQKKIEDTIKTARQEMARREIEQRQMLFFRAVESNDRQTALDLIDPTILRAQGADEAWTRLRIAAGLLKMAKIDSEKLRVENVILSEDGLTATVLIVVFRSSPDEPRGSWRKLPPAEWRFVNGHWRLRPESLERPPREIRPRPPLHGPDSLRHQP